MKKVCFVAKLVKLCYNIFMDIYASLNVVTDYIENHLYEQILDKQLSRLTGINYYSLNNAFSLIAGVTLKDYIRKRRLSNIIIHKKNKSVLDLSLICGYDSPISFTRAFKEFHGFCPSKIEKNKNFKFFPKLTFEPRDDNNEEIKIEYKTLNPFSLYCNSIECADGDYKAIEKFWQTTKQNTKIKDFNKLYGILTYENSKIKYFIGAEKKFEVNNKKVCVEGGTYLSVKLNTKQSKIISTISASVEREYRAGTDISKQAVEIYSDSGVELLYKFGKN